MTSRKYKLRRRTSATAKRLAAVYECGHCTSQVAGTYTDAAGTEHIGVAHSEGCPVLTGVLPDTADTLRAAARAGLIPVALVLPPGGVA